MGLLELAEATDAMTPDCEGVEGIDFLGAHAADAVKEFPVLSAQCIACAYRVGTEANLHPISSRSAKECVERSHPFWCHLVDGDLGMKSHLCAGWVDGLRARHALALSKGSEG